MAQDAPRADAPAFHPADAMSAALRRLLVLGAALLLMMSGFRGAFVLRYAHPEIWSDFLGDLPAAFGLGVLHDLRITLLFLLPTILSLLWMRGAGAERWEAWIRRSRLWCFAGITALITLLVSDFLFYSFFRSHFSVLAYGFLEDDLAAVASGAWKIYPIPLYVFLILAAGWLLHRALGRLWDPARMLAGETPHHGAGETERRFNLQLTAHVAATVALLSWSLSPAPVRLASELPPSQFVRQVPLNGVEELAAAVWLRLTEQPYSVAERMTYAGDRDQALRDFGGAPAASDEQETLAALPPQALAPRPPSGSAAPPHVVLVVMESFATRPLGWQHDEFDLLASLEPYWRRGWPFLRFLPSDNGSAGSILSLVTDLPYRPGTKQLSQSEYARHAFATSAARTFAARGYETRFLYGGPLAWRRLGDFLRLQGFDEVAGESAILEELGLDAEQDATEWGVFDEHLFAAAARRLREAARPQFLILFTTTNHPPHELPRQADLPDLRAPPALIGRIRELDPLQRKQFRTYQYACDRLGRFLAGLEEEGLLDRTVIGATGDHTVGTGIPISGAETLLERAVPFFVLAPPALAAGFHPDLDRPGSHKDVIPTLAHLAGVIQPGWRGVGVSLLDEAASPFGYNPGGLYIGRNEVVLEFEGGFGALEWEGSGSLQLRPCPERPEHLELLKRGRAALALTDWIVSEGSGPARPTGVAAPASGRFSGNSR